MNIEQEIIQDITRTLVSNMSFSKYEPQVQKAVDQYFKSANFKEYLFEALSDQGLEYDLAVKIAKDFKAQMRKKK